LHFGQGMPAAPQLHARGPFHGLFWCSSQTQRQPSQRQQTMRESSAIIGIPSSAPASCSS
jgi:hypothetical protein